ncbi:probable chitinase 2 [Contarinia nasturtii]|uniref:probable chitinase 2 n=1 Tax=Contarinia nasturtii TaxID=265458 RepID=UPI0012D47302|nr:probable chitinase 2 [Contarinia nasturtii]
MRFAIVLMVFCLFALVASQSGPSHGKSVICYSMAEPSFALESFFYSLMGMSQFGKTDFNLCTHLIYLDYRSILANGLTTYDDDHLKMLRNKYPHLKISLGIVQDEQTITEKQKNLMERLKFVDYLVSLTVNHSFDGLHIGLTYDGPTYNATGVSTLLNDLSMSLKPKQLLLSFSPMKPPVSRSNELDSFAPIANYLDFMHLQYFGNIDEMIKLGVPPSKIVIEVVIITGHSLRRSFSIFDFDSFKSFLRYDEICDLLKGVSIKRIFYDNFEEKIHADYIDESGDGRSVLFEDTRSIANKTRNAMRRNLAGVAVFTADADDSYGKYPIGANTFDDFKSDANVVANIPNQNTRTYPMLRTVNQAIVLALDEMDQLHIPYTKTMARNQNSSDAFSWDIFIGNLIDAF